MKMNDLYFCLIEEKERKGTLLKCLLALEH